MSTLEKSHIMGSLTVCVCVPHTHTPYRVSGADRLGCPLFE